MAREDPKPKIGAGHAGGMWRTGLAEFRNIFTFHDSNIAQQHSDPGIYGCKTQGEVAESRTEDAERAAELRERNEEPRSILAEHMQNAKDAGRDNREPGKDLERE